LELAGLSSMTAHCAIGRCSVDATAVQLSVSSPFGDITKERGSNAICTAPVTTSVWVAVTLVPFTIWPRATRTWYRASVSPPPPGAVEVRAWWAARPYGAVGGDPPGGTVPGSAMANVKR